MGNICEKENCEAQCIDEVAYATYNSEIPNGDCGIDIGNVRVVVALYTYNARDKGDLDFSKGDRLGILDESDPDWWRACHLVNKKTGYIPSNYVAPENTTESEDWFFGRISRNESEKILMFPSNPISAFLIRNSEQTTGNYSLSIRTWEHEKGDHVKHYKIKAMENGGFYVTSRKTFYSLEGLVSYYSERADGLCHKLTIPCRKLKPQLWDLSPVTRDEWEIPKSSLELLRKLGSGNICDVWYGKWNGNTEVAVKTLRTDAMDSLTFLNGAMTMKKFRHENLVSLFAACSEEPICIVMEYMVNGSLLNFLRNKEGKNLRLRALIDMAAQIANGMAYLEKEQLIHRDLAARNILVADNNIVKLTNCCLEGYTGKPGTNYLTKWMSPEAVTQGRFSIKSDVWSYGIVLHELITRGQVPYPGMRICEVIGQVQTGYRMPKPLHCEFPDSIYSMMLQCWAVEPEKRPTFEFLFSFFDDYFVATEPSYQDAEDF